MVEGLTGCCAEDPDPVEEEPGEEEETPAEEDDEPELPAMKKVRNMPVFFLH